jgi:Uma2 family endonuclease
MIAGSVLETASKRATPKPPRLSPVDFALEKARADAESLKLLESDGIPMETYWHFNCMSLLIDQIEYRYRDRDDYYVGGDNFIYFSVTQAKNLDFRGPDFFFVSDTTRKPIRKYWVVWEENRTPNVVIELASASTRDVDYGVKFAIYRDRLRVNNYFIYDPETHVLDGWILQGDEYVAIEADPNGRLWCEHLQLYLGEWEGPFRRFSMTWLRFFDPSGLVVPTTNEAANAAANAEQQRAEAEKQRAEAEKQRAEAEKQRAEAEKRRAEGAEAEVARLKALLAQASPNSKNGASDH